MASDAIHDRLLAIVLSLPEAYEDRPWGEVHCKVAGKIFVGWGRHASGEMSVGFKTDKELQAMLVASDPRFKVAAYVGKHGWTNMTLPATPDWAEVEQFIVDSYRRVAPKKLVRVLDAKEPPAIQTTVPKAAAKKAAAKTARKSAAATKTTRGRR